VSQRLASAAAVELGGLPRDRMTWFATADVDPRYVVSSTDAAAVLARQLFDLVHQRAASLACSRRADSGLPAF
jgi:hypothetical protein